MAEQTPTDEPVEYAREDVSVLIVGAGAAGARTAIELAERGIEDVLVLGKRGHGDAHTTWARGGINGALGTHDPEDSPAIHAADTLNEGHHLNDPAKVETVTEQMPERLRELDEWGMEYSRTEDGEIAQRFFGAQSFRRTAFAGDHTGESLLNTLVDRAQELSVPYRENVMITKLVSDGETVYGAVGFDMDDGEFVLFNAGTVVLAAGGHAAIYNRHTSRDDENNGDGAALASDAGASLMDMEFMQFHPTGMAVDESDPKWAPWSGRLVTEAVRGEGGRLFNSEGERFMERYSPDQMELDARDVVARAIAQEVAEGRGTENGGVYLDISHRDADFIRERLPRMYERFDDLGVDMAEEPVEVAPTSHYGMGGVAVDDGGETDVDGLFAIGETMAGVHGANRLGG
ncbi:MAG: L-aspartate oxidase, partial [Methanobacteriota archaeon]